MSSEIDSTEFDLDKHLKELQQEYLQDLPENIDEIDNLILALENSSNPEVEMRNISGMIHTIKGTAGSYDMTFASTVCHNFEDFMAALHVSNVKLNTQVDNFLKFTSLLREYTDACISGNTQDFEQLSTKLAAINSSFTTTTTKKHRVLIIESTKSLARQYLKVFHKLNIEGSLAKHGYDALGRLLKEDFDSLITVAQTELLDGISLIAALRAIKTNNQNIPAILITSNSSIHLPEQLAPAYLLQKKPGLLNDLEETYTKILSQSHPIPETKKTTPTKEAISKPNNELQKILYIDDDKDLQPLVKLGLKKIETLVDTQIFTSPIEALENLDEFKPDLILLDFMMPEMDGPTVLKYIQNHQTYNSIPVIFLTAKDSQEEKDSIMNLGAAGIINKPIKVKMLGQLIIDIWNKIK